MEGSPRENNSSLLEASSKFAWEVYGLRIGVSGRLGSCRCSRERVHSGYHEEGGSCIDVVITCKVSLFREDPSDTTSVPSFNVRYLIDEVPISLAAGNIPYVLISSLSEVSLFMIGITLDLFM